MPDSPKKEERRETARPEREYERTIGTRLRSFGRELGPGLITGAADDDPSGIATYSQAGAAFGFGLLWTTLITLPLMTAVQLMCARIGLVSQQGLAAVVRDHYSKFLLWGVCALLLFGNVVNIAANLGGMGAAAGLVTGYRSVFWVPLFTLTILAFLIFSSYRFMTSVLKWLTLVLFSYVISAFLANPDWSAVADGTFHPHFEWSREYLLTFVAILGTTISPYLFFWQAAQNVEQQAEVLTPGRARRSIERELRTAGRDVGAGMLISNVIMFFIILTAGSTLHPAGITTVDSAADAAAALEPVAGQAASLIFALGIMGTGMLGVPVLAGSAAYAVAEAGQWRRGMNRKPRQAHHFYVVIVLAMLIGMALNFAGVNPMRMLFGAAVVNGVLAPPLIVVILLICNNRGVMGEKRNGWLINTGGIAAALLMGAGAITLLISWM
jgi:NRAMP (natural resistance-associated macrophage protein)-like metal ion transporter